MGTKKESKFEDNFGIIKHKLPYWNELPEIDLYMDQVIVLMDKYLSFHKTNDDDVVVTHSMINNYVKLGIMPAPIKKKYSREHIAYLLMICSLKAALPIADIKSLIESRIRKTSIEETFNMFSDLYDQVHNTVVAIGKKFSIKNSDDDMFFSDTALFLAMGSSSSKYIASKIAEMNRIEDKN